MGSVRLENSTVDCIEERHMESTIPCKEWLNEVRALVRMMDVSLDLSLIFGEL